MNPRKTARQGRSAATVDAIVEAAARILEAAGPSGYTTNAIAQRAGVSVGSLYQYFPNKDAITRALICGSAWKRDPGSGVIGVEKGPLIPVV
ncbi:TetR/AcrR family transcriptional regulator [Sphingomonas sanguinis]